VLVAVGLLVAVVVAALSFGRPDVIVVTGSPLLGKPAPAFSLEGLHGGRTSLADFRGRPLIVNFWASWCIPCREEFPLLRAALDRHAAAGLEVVGIVHDDDPASADHFAATYGATWPLALDPADEAWRAYGGTFLPLTFFVGRDGVVRAVSYGTPTEAALDAQIAKISGE